MKTIAKREGPLKIDMPFDEAMTRALKVGQPLGGRKEYERSLKAKQPRKSKQQTRKAVESAHDD